jgi:hypothetical protein
LQISIPSAFHHHSIIMEANMNANNDAIYDRLQRIDIKLANIEARHRNSSARMADDRLIPLLSDDGAFPDGFPPDLENFLILTDAEITKLLQFYGVPFGPEDDFHRHLHRFLGVPH